MLKGKYNYIILLGKSKTVTSFGSKGKTCHNSEALAKPKQDALTGAERCDYFGQAPCCGDSSDGRACGPARKPRRDPETSSLPQGAGREAQQFTRTLEPLL